MYLQSAEELVEMDDALDDLLQKELTSHQLRPQQGSQIHKQNQKHSSRKTGKEHKPAIYKRRNTNGRICNILKMIQPLTY